jgi:hypothetical protein
MRSMQCNVEFGYQLSIHSGAKENRGKPWSCWPVAGPSGIQTYVFYAAFSIADFDVEIVFFQDRYTVNWV